ncbi:hypothetical protein [Deinococcus multiflagellatus]|uniref:hypothetical protein n=1 Tax=Deinococcus multiflagellatus TaxID=1656887 RepID=UPI0021E2A6C6|nr:hypothetical protein [Deinococcus multiflagellatus]
MPDQLNRSPCPPAPERPLPPGRLLLQESVTTEHGMRLTEQLGPDRGNASLREEKRNGETVTLVDVTVATAGRVNRNKRYYSREVWQAAIDAAQPEIEAGRLWGLLEHPKDGWNDWDPLKGRLETIWVIYEKLWLEGDVVKATGILIDDHASGQTMRALLKKKVAVGISSNGTGSAQYLPAKEIPGLQGYPDPEETICVIQTDFRLLTIDAVSDPSDLSGLARQKETHRPKEGKMHPKLKALLERFPGLTLEQIKAQHQTEYAAAMIEMAEAVAREGAPTPAPAPTPTPTPAPTPAPSPTPASNVENTLERTVLGLTSELQRERREKVIEKRTNIAITALEAAGLPKAPKVKDIDLDARFRDSLIAAATAANSDTEAQELVAEMIAERRALMQGAAQEGQRGRGGGHINLPVGDNSREDTRRTDEGVRRMEGVRSRAGLI